MKQLSTIFLIIAWNLVYSQNSTETNDHKWMVSVPVLEKGESGSFDETAVKDPSIVYFNNAWHLFYTARGNREYTTAYVTAPRIKDLNKAPRFELKQIRGKTRYGCAPQVFYFEPHKKWYLIFQNRDSNYQPAFSTNTEISNPSTWAKYQNLLEKDTDKKWIDFWVIAGHEKMFLFYTEAHKGVMVRSTKINDFPEKWGPAKMVFSNIHEAVHIYKVAHKIEFHMFYELNNKGVRSFGWAKAKNLEGLWKKVNDDYANGEQLYYNKDQEKWTEMVSHGEMIRSGYNQNLEYNPTNCKWLIQGLNKKDLDRDYPSLPWKLGIIEMAK
jgi:hypothetical protein